MKCKYSAQAHEAMMQMRKAEEETSRDENPEGKAGGDEEATGRGPFAIASPTADGRCEDTKAR
jgi:hypothetical protein